MSRDGDGGETDRTRWYGGSDDSDSNDEDDEVGMEGNPTEVPKEHLPDRRQTPTTGALPNRVVDLHDDDSVQFVPRFSKSEAEYVWPGEPTFDPEHDRCADCVHYIPGGGCHLVQGPIRPTAYCKEFYADYGAFAHDHGDYVETNLELVGEAMEFDERAIDDFLDDVEERLQQRRREREAEAPASGSDTTDDDEGWWPFW